jgi:hypothetical protein
MAVTLLPAKSSCPVQAKPCRVPSMSAKNGSLRRPASSRIRPVWTGGAMPSKLTGIDAARTSPDGSGWRAAGPVAYQAVPVCVPPSYWEKVKVNAASACASPSVSTLIR